MKFTVKKLGHIYYIKHIFQTLLIKRLSFLSTRDKKNNDFQAAIFSFDGIGTIINVKGVYEREQLDTVMGWMQSKHPVSGSAVDIGANIGNHGLYFSRFYSNVFCFEPNPRIFKLLEINSRLVNNIKPSNFGLPDMIGHVPMRCSQKNMCGSKIVSELEEDSSTI